MESDDRGGWTPEQFDAVIAANKRDFDARLAKARLLMVSGSWTAAMDELLEIVMRDKAWNNAVPRKTFVAILELLTPPRPKTDPAAEKALQAMKNDKDANPPVPDVPPPTDGPRRKALKGK